MKIVFICGSNNQTPYSEFIPLANFFSKNKIDSFFILENKFDQAVLDKINESTLDYYIGDKKNYKISSYINPKNEVVVIKNGIKHGLKKFIPSIIKDLIRQFIDIYAFNKYFSKTDKIVNEVLKKENPDALIVYGDRGMGLTPSAIKWMKSKGKKVIDIQIAVSDENFLYTSRKNNFYFSIKNPFNFIISKIFPDHKKCFENESVLFFPWSLMIILYLKNMLPSQPWYLGQSWADKFLVISEKDKTYIDSKSSTISNSTVVGQYSHDFLFDVYKNKENIKCNLLKKYFNIDTSSKEIIIFAMPQFYEHNIFDKDRANKEILYILDSLSKFDNKLVLLSLHPKMPFDRYSFINEKYVNIKIIKDERLSEVLPISNYFISIFESTISWALMCNIVPVFLDYYNLGFDLSRYSSVQVVNNKAEFYIDLLRIFDSKNNILKRIENDKGFLPPFDGKSGERILNEIKKTNEK